jgi:plastocyanin
LSHRFFRCSLALPLLTLLALTVFAGCGSSSGAPGDTNSATATASVPVLATNTPGSAENQVDVSDFQFSPSTLTVKVGTTVTWKGVSGAHTVTSDDSAPMQFDQPIAEGGVVTVTFTQAGTYEYHCSVHKSMRGKIIVTA